MWTAASRAGGQLGVEGNLKLTLVPRCVCRRGQAQGEGAGHLHRGSRGGGGDAPRGDGQQDTSHAELRTVSLHRALQASGSRGGGLLSAT